MVGVAKVRFATFNASLSRPAEGQLRAELVVAAGGGAVVPQLRAVLDIVAINDPDVLVVNEFDTGTDGDPETVARFAELAGYPYWFTAPSNTGVQSGFDLDRNGTVGAAGDAFGFGAFPGQFGLAVLSKYAIQTRGIRTFQTFRWADMPGALLPVDDETGESWYTPEELAVLRLSSKSHWDVPIGVGRGRDVHVLVSHPTPPGFDGPERRNGRRNFDEIRFWADYITPGTSSYIYDDAGQRGGLGSGESFVVAGDLNADPLDGESVPGAIQQLLDHGRVNARFTPRSDGAVEASRLQLGANVDHLGDPQYDTADFADTAPGNLRVDYVLPSSDLHITDGGVFWPRQGEDGAELTGVFPFPSSDHRLVYVDIRRR